MTTSLCSSGPTLTTTTKHTSLAGTGDLRLQPINCSPSPVPPCLEFDDGSHNVAARIVDSMLVRDRCAPAVAPSQRFAFSAGRSRLALGRGLARRSIPAHPLDAIAVARGCPI